MTQKPMRARSRLVGSCLLFFLVFGASSLGITDELEGKFSTVRLIEITLPNSGRPWSELSGAPDGIRLIFLVVRKPGVRGVFALKELRDFTINGQSYRALTRKALGREYEPGTTIWNVREFLRIHRQDLRSQIAMASNSEADVTETTIGGATLPPQGELKVTIEVGWGSDTEQFSFTGDLAKINLCCRESRP